MIQFIRNLTESNNNLASAIKVQTSQDKQQGGRMRELIENIGKLEKITNEFFTTIKVDMEVDTTNQRAVIDELSKLARSHSQFLGVLTSFFALQKKLDLEKKTEEEASKPTLADSRY